jgi:hypothetical protein
LNIGADWLLIPKANIAKPVHSNLLTTTFFDSIHVEQFYGLPALHMMTKLMEIRKGDIRYLGSPVFGSWFNLLIN